jgi:MipA family protein
MTNRRLTNCHLALTAALLVHAPLAALAQSTHMLMPEGSKDIYLSLAAVHSPRSLGSADSEFGIVPVLAAQWANGVFINNTTLGLQLSDDEDFSYGPLFAASRSRTPGADGKDGESRFRPQLGGFLFYRVSSGVSVSSRLLYGGSSDRRGLRVESMASYWQLVSAHHSIGVAAGATLANRSALQADFGVTPGEAGRFPVHAVHSGMRDASLALHWRWELTHKTALHSWVEQTRFLGSAGASPRLEQRNGTTAVTMVTWRF